MSEIRVNRISVNTDPTIDIASPISTNVEPNKLVLPRWAATARPGSPVDGQFGFNTTDNLVEYYNASTATW